MAYAWPVHLDSDKVEFGVLNCHFQQGITVSEAYFKNDRPVVFKNASEINWLIGIETVFWHQFSKCSFLSLSDSPLPFSEAFNSLDFLRMDFLDDIRA